MPAHVVSLGEAVAAVRSLGAPPIGSPSLIRAHAVHLRRTADQLESAGQMLGGCAAVGGYLGPAARRHQHDTEHETRMLMQRVVRLRELASRLEGEAGALEGRQHAWRARFNGRAMGLPGDLGHQALRYLGWRLP